MSKNAVFFKIPGSGLSDEYLFKTNNSEVAMHRCTTKYALLKISQNSLKNTYA